MDINVEFESAECKVTKWLQDLQAWKPETYVTTYTVSNETNFQTDNSKNLDVDSNSSCSEKARSRSHETFSNSDCSDPFVPILKRCPYVDSERLIIINYIVEHDLFHQIKGNIMWQKMENLHICSRTWQSMKSQFMKYIWPHIDDFHLSDLVKGKFANALNSSNKREPGFMQPHQRGWREKVNYYTFEEDVQMLNYILLKRRYKWTHGNSLWMQMCEENILPERSWQSLMSRFFTILPYLSRYKLKDNEILKLMSRRDSKSCKRASSCKYQNESSYFKNGNEVFKKKELNATSPYKHSCVTEFKVTSRDKQKIRKAALMTGIALASSWKNNKMLNNVSKNTSENEIQSDISIMHEKAKEKCQDSGKETCLHIEEHSSEKGDGSSDNNLLLNITSSTVTTIGDTNKEKTPIISDINSELDHTVKPLLTLLNNDNERCPIRNVNVIDKSRSCVASINGSNAIGEKPVILFGCKSRTEQGEDCNVQRLETLSAEEESDFVNCLEDNIVLRWENEEYDNNV